MSPYTKLARAVIAQAFKDIDDQEHKDDAIAFLTRDADFGTMRRFWSEGAGLDPDAVCSEAKRRMTCKKVSSG